MTTYFIRRTIIVQVTISNYDALKLTGLLAWIQTSQIGERQYNDIS